MALNNGEIVGTGSRNNNKYKINEFARVGITKNNFNNLFDFLKIENGKLSLDKLAQFYGFSSNEERKKYIRENPNLYTVMGGYKYEPNVLMRSYTPVSEEDKKKVVQAQEKDKYVKSPDYILDKKYVLDAQEKRAKNIPLTDREIQAEIKFKWLEGSISSDDIPKIIKKEKTINSAITKFNNGEKINLSERMALIENGGHNFTEGNTYTTIDFLAKDNPKNILAFDAYKNAIEKEKNGEKLTNEEKTDISNYIVRNEIKKSIVKDKYTLDNDIKNNADNLNTIAATNLYNDAIYKKGPEKTFAQMELYTSTGVSKYLQDTVNTGIIFFTELEYHTGLGEERASDVIKEIPPNKFEVANNAVAQYFTINDKKINKFIQDTTVSMANNVIPMLLNGISGGASLMATGISAFGASYGDAVRLAPEAEEWQYWTYAGVNTSTEVLLEMLLSGDKNIFASSGSDFTEAMFKSLSKNISNKVLVKGVYVLSNCTGELLEESIQGLVSPVLQKTILGADVVSISSTNDSEQLQALKNALYDGFIGFASAGVTTGLLDVNATQSINQKQTAGAYYKKLFNDLDVDIENVAVYLKEISNEKNTNLFNAAEKVLNGDKSDIAVAEMMIYGFEVSREAQAFIYKKIGEQLNKNNRYTVYDLIRQYNKISENGIKLSNNITDVFKELINIGENMSIDRFNYLVGKLSTSMAAVLPRASVASELVKKIESDINEKNSSKGSITTNERKSYSIDEKAFIDGLWEGSENSGYNESAKDVEKRQVKSIENAEKNGIIEKIVDDTGVPGEYTSSIVWQRRNVPARKVGKGYFGKRTKQYDSRVDSYELKLNPNDESYFLIHADGKPVQFENMKNGVVQDCKLVRGNNSIYYVKEKIPILNKNILQQAKRQSEAANLVGYRVEWLLSDKRAVDQMKQLFYENNLDIIVTYYPE